MSGLEDRTTRKTLRIGSVGAGGIVKSRHLPGLRALGGVEVVAVCNSTFESSRQFCNEFLPGATPIKNWADLVALTDLDIVWIGAQPYMHAPVSISALEAGKHVFCQARMALNLAEALEMRDAACANPNLVAMLCPPPHGMKGAKTMRRLIGTGAVGTPLHLGLSSLSDSLLNPDVPPHWRQRRELSGMNILTLGIYAEVLQSWFGNVVSVAANGKVQFPYRGSYEVTVPDQLDLLCDFASGLQATCRFSGVSPHPSPDRLDLEGTQGRLSYDFAEDRIWLESLDGEIEEVAIPISEQAEWEVERKFVDAVRSPDSPRPRPNFEDGVTYMKVVQAVSDSLASSKKITVAP